MKRLLLALSLAAASGFAQNALWIDLSGPWRSMTDADRPEFARPDFDDSGWKTYGLPAGPERVYPPARMWLRKTVLLPETVDRTQLTLTLGTVNSVYEVFVNGVRIGATGELTRQGYQIPRPLAFDIPTGAVPPGSRQLTVAIRSIGLRARNLGIWGMEPTGPFLLTYRHQAPPQSASSHLNNRRVRNIPDVVIHALFLGLAALLLLAWVRERGQSHMLWFALALGLEGSRGLLRFLVASEQAHPFLWLPWEQALSGIFDAVFSMFVVTALGLRQRWVRIGIWLLYASIPLANIGPSGNQWFTYASRLQSGAALCLVAVGWWKQRSNRQGAERQVFAGVIFLVTLLRLNNFSNTLWQTSNGTVGPFDIPPFPTLLLLLSVAISAQILRQLARDRTESQRLAGELEAGRSIQQLLLADMQVADGDFLVDVVYEPAQELGGDFYWNRRTPEGSLLVVVGDVSGKGLKAAMLVSVVVGILRNEKAAAPGVILRQLNEGLTGHTGGGFVTCCAGRFDADGTVTLANAGHPAPYCDGLEVEVESSLPLGIVAGVEYAESAVRGKRFTFVSDGVVEAANAGGELFGFERTRETSGRSAGEIAEAAKAWGQNDDITVVTVGRAG